jgi:1,2-phenylacetyl-CoA epoxidase catalytic subunit
VLFDQALACVLDSGLESSYLPLRQRTRKLIEEEQFHAIHGRGWLRQLSAEGPEVRAGLEQIIRQWWPDTLCWFGPEAGGALVSLVRIGVLREAGEAVRQRFSRMLGPLLQEARLAAPLRPGGDGWVLAEPLPWARWDEPRRMVRHA